ncbi:MAG TPA: hypothetical protein VLS89_06395 [Candidatus Nanopelagicales bacterium]|nr:hypothetical protein [Candidatus Nanopelagicales bacterium]
MKRANEKMHCGAVPGLLAALLLAAAGCTTEPVDTIREDGEDPAPPTNEEVIAQDPESSEGGEENTFNHDSDLSETGGKNEADIMKQRVEEGPLPIRTRMHSCTKLPVETLRNLLVDFGVNIDANAANGQPRTAGQLYRTGLNSLGVADYNTRVATPLIASSSGSVKAQDIWVQAAGEIITQMQNGAVPHCSLNGQPVQMFDANNQCNRDAITCLLGRPATDDHVGLCNETITDASTPEKGRLIAVGSILAAAHTCE